VERKNLGLSTGNRIEFEVLVLVMVMWLCGWGIVLGESCTNFGVSLKWCVKSCVGKLGWGRENVGL